MTLRAAAARAGFELPEEVTVTADDNGKKWTIAAKINNEDRTVIAQIMGPKLTSLKWSPLVIPRKLILCGNMI